MQAAAHRSAKAPAHRPTWLVLLSSLTLIYGGLLLVSGLSALRDPQAAARMPISGPQAPDEEAFSKRLAAVNTTVIAAHTGPIRARAAASLILALLMLYASAAALSRDRHGRTVTLAAAWLGIAYQVASLPVVIPLARDYARVSAPLLAEMVAAEQRDGVKGTPPETVASFVRSMLIVIPVATAAIGVGGSALIISYFGGRRGRELYGLEPAGSKR